MIRATFFIAFFCLLGIQGKAQTFTQISGARGLNTGNNKDGGAVWADFDNDGDLDLVVNTNNTGTDSRLYQSNGGSPPTFTDVTSTYAKAFLNNNCERSAIWGDLNNDGYIDFIRNAHDRLEIYINRGVHASYTDYSLGVDNPSGGADEQVPNMVFTSLQDGMNTEGVGLMDYNNDGWLDIILENHNYGIDILENNLDGKTVINTLFADGVISGGLVNNTTKATNNTFFPQVTINSNGHLGLPTNATTGDYLATGDFDRDGDIDILARKEGNSNYDGDDDGTADEVTTGNTNDLWENDGDGTFSLNTTFSGNNGSNGNKGGVVFCDFDKDGDFDIFWSDAGTNQIWLQDPTGTFTATSKPSIPGSPDIDGCACGDVDNDGDLDLFLGNDSGNSYLFINTTSAPNSTANLSFTRTDIAVNADAEGVNLVDYDNDGDTDIYVNVNGAANQLWDNDLCDGGGCDYVKILTQECIDGTTTTKPLVGGTILIKDSGGNIINAAQDMNSASGHGAQNPSILNFGLPNSSDVYTLEITFPPKVIPPDTDPTIETYTLDFKPDTVTNNTILLTSVYGYDGSTCDFSPLPIELLYFKAAVNEQQVLLQWATTTETNNDYFTLEHSLNGINFNEIGTTDGAGNSNATLYYEWTHTQLHSGVNYYRLKQTDFDGQYSYSSIAGIYYAPKEHIAEIFPNPFQDHFNIRYTGMTEGDLLITLLSMQGEAVMKRVVTTQRNKQEYKITNMTDLRKGGYILSINHNGKKIGFFKVIKE